MKHKVLLSAHFLSRDLDRFKKIFESRGVEIIAPQVHEKLREHELLEYVPYIDAAICGDDDFTETVLNAAPKLKAIIKWGTGIDSIDLKACKNKGVKVCNTPNAFTEPISDTALCYILCFARNPFTTTQAIKNNLWEKVAGFTLREKTIGIIGMGNCGKATARKLAPFGCKILGFDSAHTPSEIFLKWTSTEMVDFDTLIKKSDIVSIHCNLDASGYHLFSETVFSKMKPGAFIVNTARGPLIDEKALIKNLKTGHIAGAALDVFEHEPLPKNNELRLMNNVILSPHNGNSSKTAWEFVHYNSMNHLFRELELEEITLPSFVKPPIDSEQLIAETIQRLNLCPTIA